MTQRREGAMARRDLGIWGAMVVRFSLWRADIALKRTIFPPSLLFLRASAPLRLCVKFSPRRRFFALNFARARRLSLRANER